MIVPVILSGGEGRRLWPLSSPSRPKQFLRLTGDETLLQQTVRRLSDPALFSRPIIVCGLSQRFLIAEQLRAAGLEGARIVLEPMGRNTAPALAVAALLAAADDPDALILSAHADHAIPDTAAFLAAVDAGAPAASAGRLVLFGLEPSFPSTGYGYIRRGEALDAAASSVAQFLEKPDAARAAMLVAEGCLWNSGIFLMRAATLIAELRIHAPQVLAAAEAAVANAAEDDDFLRLDPGAFADAPPISIDHAVMERTSNAAVVAAKFAWSDIGSWSAVWEAHAHDESGNATLGKVILDDVHDTLVFAEGVRVAAHGIRDLVIVATPERVLVLPRVSDQKVRDLADRVDEAWPASDPGIAPDASAGKR
jgi:mannose-1-phosphate guanylyltransferase/mannose-1-phosphate guanylyltransferase/mannose-6-phosphate isomerase